MNGVPIAELAELGKGRKGPGGQAIARSQQVSQGTSEAIGILAALTVLAFTISYISSKIARPILDLPVEELYDLSRDPGEAVNLVAKEPDRARTLVAELRRFAAELPGDDGFALYHERASSLAAAETRFHSEAVRRALARQARKIFSPA